MTSPQWPDINLLRKAFGSSLIQEKTLLELAAVVRFVRCRPGPLELESPCTPVASWWLVHQGRLNLGTRTSDGTFVDHRGIGEGDWLDVAGALSTPRTWVDQAVCLSTVDLIGLPVNSLFTACARDPAFAQAFGRVMAAQVRNLNDRMSDITTVDVPIRLARWLLRRIGAEEPLPGPALASQVVASTAEGEPGSAQTDDPSLKPIHLVLQERKQTIAQQLGTTAETLSRTLRRLAETGILEVHRHELTVLDLSALHTLAHPPGLRRRAPASLRSHRPALRRVSDPHAVATR